MSSHFSMLELEKYVAGEFPADLSQTLHGHLETCEECRIKLAQVAPRIRWMGPEKRREARVPVNFTGRLKLLDPITSVGPPHVVQVLEMSNTGFKILTPRYLIPKTLVQVRFDGKTLLGEVRYCIKTDTGYSVGIKQVSDFPSN